NGSPSAPSFSLRHVFLNNSSPIALLTSFPRAQCSGSIPASRRMRSKSSRVCGLPRPPSTFSPRLIRSIRSLATATLAAASTAPDWQPTAASSAAAATGSVLTSDAGLLAYRELDDAIGLTVMASDVLADARTGKNGRHALAGLFRQSVFGRLAGYEDVNDAERLRHDPAMRWIVGGKAAQGCAASPSQMSRFETQWLAAPENLSAITDLSGQWIDLVHARRPPRSIVLDMDSSVSPTHGEQEMSVWNGHYACTCYHPLFVFNQFGDLERCAL